MVEDLVDAARDTPGLQQTAIVVDLLPTQQLSDALRVVGASFVEALLRGSVAALRTEFPGTRLYHIDRAHLGFVLPGDDVEAMHRTVERVHRVLTLVEGDEVPVMVRPAMGLAPFVLGRAKPDDVLRFGRSAAQEARDSGRAFATYSRDQDDAHKRQFALLADLPLAMASVGQLQLVYQPRVDIGSRRCVGAEALLRWTHPTLGPISPAEFIPLVERTGLISALTDWVVGAALDQLATWQTEGRDLVLSVNISAANLDEEDFSDRLLARVAAAGLDAGSLELELTESAILRNGSQALAALEALRGAGIRIAVDDFGTGYSSLAYLRMIPADCVKIDRSFIRNLEADSKDQHFIAVMIDMLHGMDFRVVAEGVESEGALQLLAGAGCDEAQGFHLAKPLSVEAFGRWLGDFAPAQQLRA